MSQKRSLEQRLEAISSQLNSERTTVRSMEEVLNDKRRSEWSLEANNKQLEVEKGQLQRKVVDVSLSYCVKSFDFEDLHHFFYSKKSTGIL